MADSDPTPATPADRPRRGWLRRNWLWFVPTTVLVLCGGFCIGIFGLVFGLLKSSDPYQMALQRVQNDPQVIQLLGQPIEESGWFPTGQLNIENDRGDARFDFDVAGPNGKAHVHTEARRISGRWGLTRLEVTPEDGQRIVLDTTVAGGLDEAPPFEP